jgi:diguanylate cyclase (GGDEF)-like protein
MRDGQLLRAFTTMVGASCFALVALGIVVQFHPAGPVGVLPRSVQAAVLLSAAVIGLRWLLGPWPQYRQAIAFVVWADAAVATVAVTMSTPESRLCTALYMGLTGGFAAFLLGGRILTAHCGFCVALIVGITGWGVRFEHATFFGLFVYYMPGLMWTVALPLGCLALIDLGRRSIRRTAHSAHYDPLTGLRNRRGMYAAVAAAIERTSPNITTVAVCDIDRFKVFNDSQGHAAGDTALLDMAQKLQSLAGIDDVTARIGGDELVLVAFCNSHDDIADLLGRLQPLTHRRVDGAAPTASLGVAFHDAEDPHFLLDYVLSRADAAMYEAKRAGGAKCVVYQPSITPDQAVTAIEPSPPPGLTAL